MNSKIAIQQLKAIEKYVEKNGGGDLRLASEWNEKWKILISTILSAQTKDETTISVSERLYKKFNSAKRLRDAGLKDIEKIIRQINYYKTKARNIKKTAKIISKIGIPGDIRDLLKLPGVGRKVANVYLAVAYNANAIGVDTHVARLSKKLGWTKHKQHEGYKIERDLERLFPKKYWNSINWILVKFGRTFGKRRRIEDKILETLIN